MKKKMRARSALLEMSLPHDGPTSLSVTWLTSVPPNPHGLGTAPCRGQELDCRLAQPEWLHCVAGGRDRVGTGTLGRDLPDGPTLEVDAEAETTHDEGHDAGQDDDGREDEPTVAVPDEVKRRLAVVELVPNALVLLAHAGLPSETARPRATPSQRASVKIRLRPRRMTMGRVKKYAVARSSSVDRPRKNAKPRTGPTENR